MPLKPLTVPFDVITNRLRGGPRAKYIEYAITVCCGLGSMLFGYDQGVFGGLLNGGPFQNQFPSISHGRNASLQGFTVAVYEVGCGLGAFSVIGFGDKLGRRMTVILGVLILCAGAIIQFLSYSLAQMIVGRVVTGIGNGIQTAVLPTYVAECSRDTFRGKSICWQLSINIFGIAVAYWVDFGLASSSATANNDWSWRFPLSLQLVWGVGCLSFIVFLPESPRGHIKRGQHAEAKDVLDMLSREEDPESRRREVNHRYKLIAASLAEEAAAGSNPWTDLFRQGKERFFQRTVLGIVGLCMLQISGINLITYYAPVIFQDTIGMSYHTSLLVSGFNGIAYWLSTFAPIPLIDRIGRRPLLLFGAAGQTITMALLSAMTADPGNKAKGYVAAVLLFVFNFFFACAFCPIPWLAPVEYAPLRTRGKTIALATGFFWLCNFMVVEVSPIMTQNIGYGTYIVWTITNFVMFFWIYFLVPETAGVALEDIDTFFESCEGWVIGPTSTKRMKEIREARLEREAQDQGKSIEEVGKEDKEKTVGMQRRIENVASID